MQTEQLKKQDLTKVGEEIGQELGAQMVKDYQAANPNDVKSYVVGRDIINQILAQPGCVGIRFHNAYDEKGVKTLVYVGLDAEGSDITEYTLVDSNGSFDTKKAIVADRSFDWWQWLTKL